VTDRRCILVIDDDPPLNTLLSLLLTKEGYVVRVASSGPQALDILQQWQPDLIVLDLLMDEMDGWAFRAHQQHQEWREIPVLVLTAADCPDEQRTRLGTPVLMKPFQRQELLTLVTLLLR
jgi:CheY-like chemotaxis protein